MRAPSFPFSNCAKIFASLFFLKACKNSPSSSASKGLQELRDGLLSITLSFTFAQYFFLFTGCTFDLFFGA